MSGGIDKDYIEWLENLFSLREKYKDTPPGFSDQKDEDRAREAIEKTREKYREKHEIRLSGSSVEPEERFVGRQYHLSRIEKQFREGENPVILYGIAGIGKTALAKEYIRLHQSEYDQVLFLVYENSLRDTICDDSQLCFSNLNYSRDQYTSKNHYFKEKIKVLTQIAAGSRILIVIDDCNMEGDTKLEAILDVPCDFLFTTRVDPRIWGDYRGIYVDGMKTEAEWLEFINAYRGERTAPGRRQALLDYCARIKGHASMIKLKLQERMSPEDGIPAETAENVFSRFLLKKDEQQALRELSVMPEQGITEEFYYRISRVSQKSLNRLADFLLIRREKTQKGKIRVSLHPVIAEAARKVFAPTMTNCRNLIERFSRLTWNAWSRTHWENQPLEPYAFAILEAFRQPAAWLARRLDDIMTLLLVQGYYAEAEQYWRKVDQSVKQYYGEVHQITAETSLRMGDIYYNCGDCQEAGRWYREGFCIVNQCVPYDKRYYFVRAVAYHRMARICRRREEHIKGLEYADEAIRCIECYRVKNKNIETALEDGRWERQYCCCFTEKARVVMELGGIAEADQICRTGKETLMDYGDRPADSFCINEFDSLLAELSQKGQKQDKC